MNLFGAAGAALTAGPQLLASAGSDVLNAGANLAIANRQEQLQKEFAQHGVSWRIQDAESMGLSPVYAAGVGQASSYSPQSIDLGLGNMGQNISRAAMAGQTEAQKQALAATLQAQASSSNKDDMMASYYAALAAKTYQEMYQTTGPFGSGHGGGVVLRENAFGEGGGVGPGLDLRGYYNVEPGKVRSASLGDANVTAGRDPAFSRTAGGYYYPSGDFGNSLQSLPAAAVGGIYSLYRGFLDSLNAAHSRGAVDRARTFDRGVPPGGYSPLYGY